MTAPLPPLPSSIGGDWGDPPPGRSMVDVLLDEHHQLRVLCLQVLCVDPAGPPGHRERVADVLTATISRHLSAEEQYLYPTVRAVLPDGAPIADHEIAADQEILRTLRRLEAVRRLETLRRPETLRRLGTARAGDDSFERLLHTVSDQVARHVDEASRILPRLRAACAESDLVRLGNRIEIAEEAAPTRPHPSTPATPPWNKIVDPALGVADKIRDVLARRTTYLEDL